eukprot:scaffold6354_cov126-Isochrysis_galbana.AAC.4
MQPWWHRGWNTHIGGGRAEHVAGAECCAWELAVVAWRAWRRAGASTCGLGRPLLESEPREFGGVSWSSLCLLQTADLTPSADCSCSLGSGWELAPAAVLSPQPLVVFLTPWPHDSRASGKLISNALESSL